MISHNMIQKLAMNHSDCMLENTQIKQQVKFLGTEIQRLSKKAIQHQEIVTKTLRETDALIQKQSEVNKKNFNKPFVPRRSKRSTKMKTPAKFNNFIR